MAPLSPAHAGAAGVLLGPRTHPNPSRESPPAPVSTSLISVSLMKVLLMMSQNHLK